MLVAGIDRGTTSTKGVLPREDGLATERPGPPHRQIYPVPGWGEQSRYGRAACSCDCVVGPARGRRRGRP